MGWVETKIECSCVRNNNRRWNSFTRTWDYCCSGYKIERSRVKESSTTPVQQNYPPLDLSKFLVPARRKGDTFESVVRQAAVIVVGACLVAWLLHACGL